MESTLERAGAVGGVAGIVLIAAANIQLGSPPKAEDAAVKVASFLADNRGRVLLFVALFAIAYLLLVVFAGAIRQFLRRSGDASALPDLAYGAALWTNAVGLAALLATGAGAYRAPAIEAPIAQALLDVTNVGFALLGVPFAVLFIAASLSGLRTQAFPRWVCGLGLLTGALNIAKVFTIFPRSGAFAPNGPASLIFVVPIWVWTVAVAVVMWRASGRTRSSGS